jgi:hypothetical protein
LASLLSPEAAVLELGADAAPLRAGFNRAAAAALKAPPVEADSVEAQVILFGCAGPDEACLAQVAASLKVRFLISGRLIRREPDLVLGLSLFDAERGAFTSKTEAPLSSPADVDGMDWGIRRLLEVEGARELLAPAPASAVAFVEPAPPKEAPPPPRSPLRLLAPGAARGAGAVFGVLALSAKAQAGGRPGEGGRPNGDDVVTGAERSKRRAFSIAADACLLLGAASLVTVLLPRAEAKVSAAPAPGGGAVALSIRARGGRR